ncbi:MAG: hypothetical protein AAF216_02180 [Pseudomonadota bacterium]
MQWRVILCGVLTMVFQPVGDANISDNAHFKVNGVVVVWSADPTTGAPLAADFIVDTGTGSTGATSGDTDEIAENVTAVVTGTLETSGPNGSIVQGSPMTINQATGSNAFSTDSNGDRVMDANDAFSAFGLRGITRTGVQQMEVQSSFYVASSVPFRIDTVATPVGATTTAQMAQMRFFVDGVTLSGDDGVVFGGAAQYPNSGGANAGWRNNNSQFTQLMTPTLVFVGNQRTAASRGTLTDQSVRLDFRYRYNTGNFSLSDGVFEAGAEFVYTVYIP